MNFLRKIGKRYALGLVERLGAVIDKKLVEIACFTSSMLQRKQKPNVLFTPEKPRQAGPSKTSDASYLPKRSEEIYTEKFSLSSAKSQTISMEESSVSRCKNCRRKSRCPRSWHSRSEVTYSNSLTIHPT